MITDVNDALDHLNEMIRVLEKNNLKTREDDECYEIIAGIVDAQNVYENIYEDTSVYPRYSGN